MAEDFLGISAHVEFTEVFTSFQALIEVLEKAGAVSEETANQMEDALSSMQANLSRGLTPEGLDQLFAQLDGIKGKVAETINAFAEGNVSLNWADVTTSVAAYQETTVAALNATLEAEEKEAEQVEILKASLQGLLDQREQLAMTEDESIGLEDEIRRTSVELQNGQTLLETYRERISALAEASEESRRLADSVRSINDSVANAVDSTNQTIDTSFLQQTSEEADHLREVVASYKAEYEQLLALYENGSGSVESVIGAWERYTEAIGRSAEKEEDALTLLEGHMSGLEEGIAHLSTEADRMFGEGNTEKAAALRLEIEKLSAQIETDKELTREYAEHLREMVEAETEAEAETERLVEKFGDIQMPDTAWSNFTNFFSSIKESASEVGEEVKGFGDKIGDYMTGHGKAQEAVGKLKDSLNSLPGPLGGAVSGFKNFLGAVKMFMATPIGRVLGVIVFLLKAFQTWATKSAEGQRVMAKVTAFLGSILESLTDILVKVGSYLFHAFADATGPMNAFAKGLVTTLKLAVKSASDLLVGLGDILRGIGKMFQGDFSGGWEKMKEGGASIGKALKEAGEGFVSAISTGLEGIKGLVVMAGDGIKEIWNGNLMNTATDFYSKAIAAANAADGQLEAEKGITANKQLQQSYDDRIADAKERAAKASREELKSVTESLRAMTNEKYDDLIQTQEKQLKLLKERNSLHTRGLKDIMAEQVAELQLYTLEQKRSAALRAISKLEDRRETQIEQQEKKEKNAQDRAEKAAKREADRHKRKEEKERREAERLAKRTDKQRHAEDKAESALGETIIKNADARVKEQQQIEHKIEQARIASIKDGAERALAQREYEHKKELKELANEGQEIIDAEIKRQKEEFDKVQALRKEQGKSYQAWDRKRDLDNAPIEKIKKQYEELAELRAKAWDIDEAKELTDKYQDYYDKRVEIEQQYNDDIQRLQALRSKAQREGDQEEVARLTRSITKAYAEQGKALVQNALDQLKNSPRFKAAFEDIGKASNTTLKALQQELLNAASEARKAGSDISALEKEIRKVQSALAQDTPFQAAEDAAEAARQAQERLQRAREEQQAILRGVQIIKDFTVDSDGSLTPNYKTEEDAEKNVSAAHKAYVEAMEKAYAATKKAIDVVDKLGKSFSDLGSQIGNIAGSDVISNISKAMGGIISTASQGYKAVLEGAIAAEKAGDGLDGVMAKANMYIAAISAMFKIIGTVQGLFKTSDQRYEEAVAKMEKINNLRRAVDQYSLAVLAAQQAERNWFAVDGLTSLTDAYEKHGRVVEAYYNELYSAQAKYQNKSSGLSKAMPYVAALAAVAATVVTAGAAAGPALMAAGAALAGGVGAAATAMTAAIAGTIVGAMTSVAQGVASSITYKNGEVAAKDNLRMQTRHKTFFRSEKTQNLVEWTRENLNAELFDDEGLINLEAAQTILDKYGNKLVGQTKETLERLVKLREEYDEFMKQIEEYVSNLYSPLVDNMTDALFEWLETGTDVLRKFKENATDTFKEIARDMVKQMMLATIFDPFKEDLKKIYATYAALPKGKERDDFLVNGIMAATDAFLDNAEGAIPMLQDAVTKINDKFAERGFDLTGSSEEGSGAYKAAQSFSQEQGDELNGRLTAIQIGQQQGILQRSQMIELQTLTFGAVVQIGTNVLATSKDISAMRDMQYTGLQRLAEISEFTSVLPTMAENINDMRNDIRNKL